METMANEKRHDSVDRKKFAAQMRSVAVIHDGIVHVSEELWLQIADVLEGSEEMVRAYWRQMEKWPEGGTWRCSECGRQIMFMVGTPTTERLYRCPECGAKMDGEESGG